MSPKKKSTAKKSTSSKKPATRQHKRSKKVYGTTANPYKQSVRRKGFSHDQRITIQGGGKDVVINIDAPPFKRKSKGGKKK